jgi:hypothetical protein
VAATASADPLESSSIQELLEHMSALETLAVPAAMISNTSACSSPSGRRTPGSTCRTPAPRAAAATGDNQAQEQNTAAWEVTTAEEVVDASSGAGSLSGSSLCSPAAASAGGGARCINHGLEVRINNASRDSSAAGKPGSSNGGGMESPARLSYAAAAAPHLQLGSSAGCASPKAVCRITQFAAVSAAVSQAGQANDSQPCSRTDSGIV